MKLKILLFLGAFGLTSAQTPELLYYKFEGDPNSIPNLALNPPVGTATGNIVGNLTLGPNTTCLGNGLVGSGSTGTANYFDTKWNLSLSGSWTMHVKFNNYDTSSSTVYYLLGDALSGGNSFRMFTNGAPGVGNVRLTANGMSNVNITGVFSTAPSLVDLIIVYDSVAQNIKAYVNGVLNTTVAQTTALNFNGALFKLGTYGTNTGMKAGMTMDEFGLFNRAITATEIASLSSYCVLSTAEIASVKEGKVVVDGDRLILSEGSFGAYKVYDACGKLVFLGKSNSNAVMVNTLVKGIYYVVFGEGKTARFRY